MPIQDVGTIGTWTPARLTRYIQGELNQRNQTAKASISADTQIVHNSLTFSSGDNQTADTILARPSTGIITINNVPILTASSGVVSVFGRAGAVVAASGDYTAAQVTNAADKASSLNQAFTGGKLSSLHGNALTVGGDGTNASWAIVDGGAGHQAFVSIVQDGTTGWASFIAGAKGDTVDWRYYVDGAGTTSWGPGSSARDTFQLRSAAGILKIQSGVVVGASAFSGAGKGSGTLQTQDRVFSGAAGTGGMWVDGGTSQFVGSVDATHVGFFNSAWYFKVSSSGLTTYLGTFGAEPGVGNGAAGSIAGTSITQNKICGSVVFTGQANTASVPKSFVVTNSTVTANDTVIVNMNGSTTAAGTFVVGCVVAAGSFTITCLSNTANASANFGFNYQVLRGAVT